MDYQLKIKPLSDLSGDNDKNFDIEFNLNENLSIIDNKLFLKQNYSQKGKNIKK